MINVHQRDFIKANFHKVMVSYDGLPEIQNRNRPCANQQKPSCAVVEETIKEFIQSSLNVTVRSTVWHYDFERLKEMYDNLANNFNHFNEWSIMPIIPSGRALEGNDIEQRYDINEYNFFDYYTDYADYIAALEIKMDIHEAVQIEFSRLSELTQRTNKCTNGRRYTIAEIKERITSEAVKLYSVSVSDRFSDLGLVGAIEVESDALTLFSLSCRALGRKVEEKMIEFISDKYRIKKIEFESTGKNESVKTLLSESFPNATIVNREIL